MSLPEEQTKPVQLSQMIEALATQADIKKQMESFHKMLNSHMDNEIDNQKNFIKILNDMKLEMQGIHHDIREERQTTEIQMNQCKIGLRSDIIREIKADVDSLKIELIRRFDSFESYQKDVNSKNHQDFKDIYRRLEKVESTQSVYGEYIGGIKKIMGTIGAVIIVALLAVIGLQK